MEGSRVVVELVEGSYGWGLWEAMGAEGPCTEVRKALGGFWGYAIISFYLISTLFVLTLTLTKLL